MILVKGSSGAQSTSTWSVGVCSSLNTDSFMEPCLFVMKSLSILVFRYIVAYGLTTLSVTAFPDLILWHLEILSYQYLLSRIIPEKSVALFFQCFVCLILQNSYLGFAMYNKTTQAMHCTNQGHVHVQQLPWSYIVQHNYLQLLLYNIVT